jgi:Putative peptidoglycan binding domain
MKTMKFISVVSIALIGLAHPILAGPRSGGGGPSGGFAGGGRAGGGHFSGGGMRAAPAFSGGGARFGGFARGGSRAAPAFSGGGARFGAAHLGSVRSSGSFRSAPRFYSNGTRISQARPRAFTRPTSSSRNPSVGRVANANRQPSRLGSTAGRNQPITSNARRTSTISDRQNRAPSLTRQNARISNSQASRAVQRAVANHRVADRHDGNWHRDWDKHRAHFHRNLVFVFVNGFWWGLYPWDYYPYYAYGYPYDYYSGYPYDYYGYGDDYPYNYDDQSGYATSGQYAGNSTVSAVQSELEKLGYYNGAIDGILGDQTEAAIARYQEDLDLSVSGTVDTATLQSLGIK